MRVAIVCVCYNTYEHLERFVVSVGEASQRAPEVVLQLVVVDNSTQSTDQGVLSTIKEVLPTSVYIKSANVGYFPGFNYGVGTIDKMDYDYVAISNVDLTLDPGFFKALRDLPRRGDDNIGMIAPAILSRTHDADLNPKTLYRPGRASYAKNVFIFQRPRLRRVYQWLSRLRASNRIPKPAGTTCFAPHGSFMIFTRRYFELDGRTDFPCFLFAEEDFVGEENRRIGTVISYQPSVVIHDTDHASTGKESSEFIAEQHVKSLRYIIDTYHSRPPGRESSRFARDV
jgi:GT2 family glycosyltransferase